MWTTSRILIDAVSLKSVFITTLLVKQFSRCYGIASIHRCPQTDHCHPLVFGLSAFAAKNNVLVLHEMYDTIYDYVCAVRNTSLIA